MKKNNKKRKSASRKPAKNRYHLNLLLISLFLLLLTVGLYYLEGFMTGFAVFGDTSANKWNQGIYSNTTSDGENITLLNDTLTTYYFFGNYTSRIFDAEALARWDNVSWVFTNISAGPLDMQFRTSNDNTTWLGWNGSIENGMGELNDSARYFQYKANFSTSDATYTPYLERVNISYSTISITLDTPANGTYLNTNSSSSFLTKYVNFTISDPISNLNNTWWSNDSGIVNCSSFVNSYDINIEDWDEGLINLTVWANDTSGNEIKEENFFTIDNIPPSSFGLIALTDGSETDDTTPALNWNDTNDSNLDNYTVQFSTVANFSAINSEFYSNNSNYQIKDNETLDTGTWYWRVIAYDKAGQSYTSTHFTLVIGDVTTETTEFVSTGGSGGGGRGGKKVVYGIIDIMHPGLVTAYTESTSTTPIILENKGSSIISSINLSVESDSKDVYPLLDVINIGRLNPGQKEIVNLRIMSGAETGEYTVTVKAEAKSPYILDMTKIYVNLIGFGLGNTTIINEKLKFAGNLFESNPECLELTELVAQARKYYEEKKYDKASKAIELAIKSCEDLVNKKRTEKLPLEKDKRIFYWFLELIGMLVVLSFVYRYYKKRKVKR